MKPEVQLLPGPQAASDQRKRYPLFWGAVASVASLVIDEVGGSAAANEPAPFA
jgi:hypothetical protein